MCFLPSPPPASENTGSSAPIPCPPGTSSSTFALTSEAACTPCEAGYYCPDNGAYNVTALCTEGFYCPGGDAFPTRCGPEKQKKQNKTKQNISKQTNKQTNTQTKQDKTIKQTRKQKTGLLFCGYLSSPLVFILQMRSLDSFSSPEGTFFISIYLLSFFFSFVLSFFLHYTSTNQVP